MHRHRELCARATHPLEIAAGLEAHGITDRVAWDFRHRDVFSLAEELYARVPRERAPGHEHRAAEPQRTAVMPLVHLLPGLCCLTGAVTMRLRPADELVAGVLTAVAAGSALLLCLRRGPLHRGAALSSPGQWLWTLWLAAFSLLGERALAIGLSGRPPTHLQALHPDPAAVARTTALAFAVLPAAWCAAWFARKARSRLAPAPSLREFAAAVRPLVAGAVLLFLPCLLGLLAAADLLATGRADPAGIAASAALGLLFFLARLLTVHGHPAAAGLGCALACALQAAALALAAASAALTHPHEGLLATHPGAVQGLTCSAAALALLAHGFRALGRASSHSSPLQPTLQDQRNATP
ncbi:hypothetical protein [Wenjunlia tyrosinilytica]|nr:hypothetical protein [Wenjunlia tyrosinilytica]